MGRGEWRLVEYCTNIGQMGQCDQPDLRPIGPSRCHQTIYTTYINFGRAAVKRDRNFLKRAHPLYGSWTLPSQHTRSVTKFCHGPDAWDAWMLEIKKQWNASKVK